MEGRMKNYRQVSPERAKIWTEKSPKYHYNQQQQHTRKVPVVYYLCRNQQLEHPHFMEVPLSSSDDLYLRDVIERLNVLRGRGIASMYSWSCKRSYNNGYVWHDLCDDDIIHPAHGNEYILKGSELFGRFNPTRTLITQTQKPLPEPPSFRSKEESPSSSSSNGRTTKNGGLANASTRTEENVSRVVESRNTCTRGVSTDDGLSEPHQHQVSHVKPNPEICRDVVSPLSGRIDTLESLIRADVRKLNSFRRILEEEGYRIPSTTKLKVANMIMQLISCGSISVKDHSFGLIPTYRPRFPNSKFLSPLFSTSLMLGERHCTAENPRPTCMRLKDGRSSSYNDDSCRNDKENVIKIEESLLQELGL